LIQLSVGSNYIIKTFLFFFHVFYEQRYCNAKFEFQKFTFKKRYYYRYRHRRSKKSCTIAILDARGDQAWQSRTHTYRERMRERKSERDSASFLAVDVVEFRGWVWQSRLFWIRSYWQ